VTNSIDRTKLPDDLKVERAKLFEQFLKHPKDIRLALAIMLIDDQIAGCAEWVRAMNKGVEVAKNDIHPLRNDSSTHEVDAKAIGPVDLFWFLGQ
jgi:hypothetical protein